MDRIERLVLALWLASVAGLMVMAYLNRPLDWVAILVFGGG